MKKYNKTVLRFSIVKNKTSFNAVKITSSKNAVDFLREIWNESFDICESFYVVTLNRANIVDGYALISIGGICSTVVDEVLIYRYLIENLGQSFIIAHNHPSTNTASSGQDREITNKLKDGAKKMLNCTLLDHIILTEDSYYSFADNGMI